jgi:mycothiol synthase
VSVEIRRAHESEAAALADLMNEHARRAFGETELGEAEVRHWFTLPEIWIRVAERGGELVGYMDATRRGEAGAMELDVRALDREAAEALLAAAEDHERKGKLRAVAQGDDLIMPAVLEEDGWKLIRSSYQMRIELDGDVPEPRWPDGVVVRTLEPGEEERVYETNNAAFADHWDFAPQSFEHWRAYIDRPNFDPTLWWLVEAGGELIAFSANTWHFSGDPEFGWVDILGVRPQWRRRGLGTALLHQSFQDFRERGATRVGLGVDAENTTGAVRLYERAGMQVHRRNDMYEKVVS